MTSRERILGAFRGESIDRVPFAPNIYQWFHVRRANGTLPSELEGMEHPFEVLRFLGADILARWDTQACARAIFTAGRFSEQYRGSSAGTSDRITAFNHYPPGCDECRRQFETPYGPLTEQWNYSQSANADFQSEFMWKNWDDFPKIKFFLESRDYEFDAQSFRGWFDRAGPDGVVMVHLTQSPLKTFHWLAGAERTTYFAADHPKEMQELAAIHEEKAIALLNQTLDFSHAEVFVSLDNLDSAFYSPSLYERYCHPFFMRAASLIHTRNKVFVVHACGHTRALLPQVAASGVDCLEGITPPPVGNVDFGRIRSLTAPRRFVINGGIEVHHVEDNINAESRIHDYTRRLFGEIGDLRGFIYASSCNTSPAAPWENIIHFRNASLEYGNIRRLDIKDH